MHLRESGDRVVIHTPAKLNLFFEVLDRRSDGFHEVETLVYPIDLCDTVVIRRRADERVRFRVSCVPSGSPPMMESRSVKCPPTHPIWWFAPSTCFGRRVELTKGRTFVLIKRIPSEAGLGGGSSDAAAALVGANRAWNLSRPIEELAEIGAVLGSDIPLFLRDGASVCRGRGEIVETVPSSPILHFVLVRPPVGLSTADVYRACRVSQDPHSISSVSRSVQIRSSRPNWNAAFQPIGVGCKRADSVDCDGLGEPSRTLIV